MLLSYLHLIPYCNEWTHGYYLLSLQVPQDAKSGSKIKYSVEILSCCRYFQYVKPEGYQQFIFSNIKSVFSANHQWETHIEKTALCCITGNSAFLNYKNTVLHQRFYLQLQGITTQLPLVHIFHAVIVPQGKRAAQKFHWFPPHWLLDQPSLFSL